MRKLNIFFVKNPISCTSLLQNHVHLSQFFCVLCVCVCGWLWCWYVMPRYLSGVDIPDCHLVIDVATQNCTLFVPRPDESYGSFLLISHPFDPTLLSSHLTNIHTLLYFELHNVSINNSFFMMNFWRNLAWTYSNERTIEREIRYGWCVLSFTNLWLHWN